MNRNEVYDLIDAERIAQDAVWREGKPVESQYNYYAPHILLLKENTDKLGKIWYGLKDEGSLQDRLVKIAAIAVRALEEVTITK